ncbi:MAG: hypothetical protein Kow00124_11440 [Anaerolineae bacterium]
MGRLWAHGLWARLVLVGIGVLLLRVDPVPEALRGLEVEQARGAALAARYEAAYAYQPWHDGHLVRLAGARLDAADYAGALDALQRLAAVRPLTPQEIAWQGRAYAGLGSIDQAVASWETAWAAGSLDPASLRELAAIYERDGQFELAAAALESLLEQGGPSAEAAYRLGVLRALDDPAGAAGALALARTPGSGYEIPAQRLLDALQGPAASPEVMAGRTGVALLAIGELEQAARALERALDYNPAYAEALAYLAYVRERQGIPSLGAAEQAAALAGDNPLVHYLAGLVWNLRARPVEARQHFTQAALLDPTNPAFLVELAGTYRAEGSPERAELWMQQAAALAPDDPRFQILLVQFYVDEGYRIEEVGLPLAEALVERYPENAEAYDALGWAQLLLGRTGEAAMALDRALTLNPRLARAHYHQGRLLEAQGLPDAALAHYRLAVQAEPGSVFATLSQRAIDRLGG